MLFALFQLQLVMMVLKHSENEFGAGGSSRVSGTSTGMGANGSSSLHLTNSGSAMRKNEKRESACFTGILGRHGMRLNDNNCTLS